MKITTAVERNTIPTISRRARILAANCLRYCRDIDIF
jgi:hypothetical protein